MVPRPGNIQRYKSLIISAIIFIITPLFFIGGIGEEAGRSVKKVWDLGHVLFFFLLTVQLDAVLAKKNILRYKRIFFLIPALVLLASFIEIIQVPLPGRMMSYTDILYCLSGMTVAFTTILVYQHKERKWRLIFFLVGSGIVIVTIAPLLFTLMDEYHAKRDFPLLADFESSNELTRWERKPQIIRVNTPVMSGEWSLKLPLGVEKYPGIFLRYFPHNWENKKALSFNVFNPDEPVMLYYRVHDAAHRGELKVFENRFNGSQQLGAGWNRIVIPMAEIEKGPVQRKMDLSNIKGFGLFLANNPFERVIYLDRVELID